MASSFKDFDCHVKYHVRAVSLATFCDRDEDYFDDYSAPVNPRKPSCGVGKSC